MDQSRPAAEVEVDARVVADLLESQCPDFADLAPVLVDEGWDNFTFRLGEDHALRLPRRRVAAGLLANEQRWLPRIADWISLAVPLPVVIGEPGELFPWPWSLVRWVHGTALHEDHLGPDAARRLASELRSLHRPAPDEAPQNPLRGIPLSRRRDVVEPRLNQFGSARLGRLWRDALEAEPSTDRVWLHGDLHPRNVVVQEGRVTGLIDWGDLNGGDRSTDLACAWTLLEQPAREAFLEAYGPTQSELVRAVGWAVNFGCALLESGEPRHVPLGQDVMRRLLESGGPERL